MGADPRRRGQAGRPGAGAGRGRVLGRPVLVHGRRGRAPVRHPGRGGAGRPGGRRRPTDPAGRRRRRRPDRPGGPDRGGLRRPGLRRCPAAKVAVLAESDVTGRRRPHRQARTRARPVDGFFDDLAPGSYVVHRQHGVARYGGMVTRTMGGATRDYLLLEYRGGGQALPAHRPDRAAHPLRRRGLAHGEPAGWLGVAAGPVQGPGRGARDRRGAGGPVPAAARRSPGHAFGPDTPWQAELESSFPFVETSDQLRAIEDVKADMERPQPMDRLVCGDVGFGKTEVAIRAVFKAVQDGYQAAVLVPDHPAGQPARPDLRRAVRALPGAGWSCSAGS